MDAMCDALCVILRLAICDCDRIREGLLIIVILYLVSELKANNHG